VGCPGNERAGGARNPKYQSTFVFTNDFAALKPEVQLARQGDSERGLLLSESEAGTCRVMCFSPRHDQTLARMTVPEITSVVDVWVEQSAEIGSLPYIRVVVRIHNPSRVFCIIAPLRTVIVERKVKGGFVSAQ
jgi:UDPglucose--hexose-1-phosphate uridylyltransferase